MRVRQHERAKAQAQARARGHVVKPARNLKKPTSRENGKLGGRPKGAKNKVTADIRELAQKFAPDAVKELGRLSCHANSEQARVAAIKEILDRGYGKSPQPLVGDDDPNASPIRMTVEWLKAQG